MLWIVSGYYRQRIVTTKLAICDVIFLLNCMNSSFLAIAYIQYVVL